VNQVSYGDSGADKTMKIR